MPGVHADGTMRESLGVCDNASTSRVRFHRRENDPRLSVGTHSGGTPPPGSRGGAGGRSDQPAICHRYAEHAGLDHAQYRPLCARFRAWADGAVRLGYQPPFERRSGERERRARVNPFRLHAGRGQRRDDGAALGAPDSRGAGGAGLCCGQACRRPRRHADDPDAGRAGNARRRRKAGSGACESDQVG